MRVDRSRKGYQKHKNTFAARVATHARARRHTACVFTGQCTRRSDPHARDCPFRTPAARPLAWLARRPRTPDTQSARPSLCPGPAAPRTAEKAPSHRHTQQMQRHRGWRSKPSTNGVQGLCQQDKPGGRQPRATRHAHQHHQRHHQQQHHHHPPPHPPHQQQQAATRRSGSGRHDCSRGDFGTYLPLAPPAASGFLARVPLSRPTSSPELEYKSLLFRERVYLLVDCSARGDLQSAALRTPRRRELFKAPKTIKASKETVERAHSPRRCAATLDDVPAIARVPPSWCHRSVGRCQCASAWHSSSNRNARAINPLFSALSANAGDKHGQRRSSKVRRLKVYRLHSAYHNKTFFLAPNRLHLWAPFRSISQNY